MNSDETNNEISTHIKRLDSCPEWMKIILLKIGNIRFYPKSNLTVNERMIQFSLSNKSTYSTIQELNWWIFQVEIHIMRIIKVFDLITSLNGSISDQLWQKLQSMSGFEYVLCCSSPLPQTYSYSQIITLPIKLLIIFENLT